MTEMKWMQVFSRRGAELDLVRSCYRVSMKFRNVLGTMFADFYIHIRDIAHNIVVVIDDS